jgi:uncharacterized protein (TIGR04222 family)
MAVTITGDDLGMTNDLMNMSGPEFLGFFLPASLIAFFASALLLYLMRPSGEEWRPDDPYDVALARGGFNAVLEAAVAKLVHSRAITIDGTTTNSQLALGSNVPERPHVAEQAVLRWVKEGDSSMTTGSRLMESAMSTRQRALIEKGVLIGDGTRWFNYFIAASPMLVMGWLGADKMMVGLSRGRPVAFLVLSLGLMAVALVVMMMLRPKLTSSAVKTLNQAKAENSALRYAGTGGSLSHLDGRDVMFSVALFGMAPLIGTELGPVQRLMHPPGSSGGSSCGGSSCSSSSCGSSCGGGCGGGCGGCGG